MNKKRGLGRGLDALLSGSRVLPTGEIEIEDAVRKGELRKLPIEQLQRGRFQPRKKMDQKALEDLAESINAQGIIQPIVVRPLKKDQYEIIAGERRWRAAQLAGLNEIPALVREIPDKAAIAIGLIENIQRENLNPIEEAETFERLMEEFQLTQQEVADTVGRSRPAVANILRLLHLNTDVRALLEARKLEMGHARALLSIDGKAQSRLAQIVAHKGLSVRETERLVQRWLAGDTKNKPSHKMSPDVATLQLSLSEKLGAKVAIQHNVKGKGKLIIQYNSLDELDGILEHIK